MMHEKFELKWDEFQPHMTKTFSLLRNDSNFTDVTLITEDRHKVTAHKVILSASCEYFKYVLSQSHHSHLLICLDGVTKEDLNNIIEFIYHGEIKKH